MRELAKAIIAEAMEDLTTKVVEVIYNRLNSLREKTFKEVVEIPSTYDYGVADGLDMACGFIKEVLDRRKEE